MGVTVKYVQVDKKTGRMVFRRTYPADLRPFVPGQCRELIRTLKSTKLDAAAQALHDEAMAEFERVVARARKVAAGQFDSLGDAQVA